MAIYTSDQARRSLIDTVWLRAVSQIATVLSYVVMVRAMSKEDFGVFNLLYAFIPVVSTVASLGLEQILKRYQPEYLRAGNAAAAAWLVRFVASSRFGTNIIVLGLVLFAWNYVAPHFKLTPYRAEFAAFCILVLLFFQARILELSLASHMLHRYSVGSLAVLAVAKLFAYCFLAWRGELTLWWAIVADTSAYALAYFLLAYAHRVQCGTARQLPGYRLSPVERRRLMRYGVFNNFNDAGTLALNTKIDNFFIAALIDPISVGVYSFYARLKEMAHQLLPVRLFDNVIRPLFFAVGPNDADRKIPQYFTLLLNMNLLLHWPILAFCIVYHEELVQVVFGNKYAADSWLLAVIVGLGTFGVVDVPATLTAQYEEKAGILLVSKVFGVYNIAAMLLLVPLLGIYGAAIAGGSAQALKNCFVWWHVRERARWENSRDALAWGIGLWGGVVAVCELLKAIAGSHQLLSLSMGVLVVCAGFLVHLRGPAIAASDREILALVLRGKERATLQRLGLFSGPAGPN